MTDKTNRPLAGVRVLDFATGALAMVGRHLSDLGAEVVRVEPPGGGADRSAGVRASGVGLAFAAGALGKQAVALDLTEPGHRVRLDDLAARADILIEAFTPGSPEHRALDAGALRARFPGLVIFSMPGFGPGALETWQASEPVLHALSGVLARSGLPGRDPLLPPGELALQCAATQGAYVLLMGWLNRLQTGLGDHLVMPQLDAVLHALDPGYGMSGTAAGVTQASSLPWGRPDVSHRYPILPCADGFVRLCILAAKQWQALFKWIGSPPEFADPAFNSMEHRFASPTLLPYLASVFATRTRADLEEDGQRNRVPIAAVNTREEAIAAPQFAARGALAQAQIAPGVRATFPNGLMEIDGERMGFCGPPPGAARDAAALIADWGEVRPAPQPSGVSALRPLEGLRVLDLGVVVVGGEQGRLLGDFGADVVKIEHSAFPDSSRRVGVFTASFAAGNRNKRSLGLNLKDPRGRALFMTLLEKADVVVSNYKPGTLESLDLAPETLFAANPRLVLVDNSAFGPTGPWRGRMGYGPLVRATTGLTWEWSYPGSPPAFSDAITVYPDHVAARVGALGVAALLVRRHHTGRGGRISASQAEAILAHTAPEIAAISLRQAGVALEGSAPPDAPFGVFPCAGEDDWCVVTVQTDAQWRALCDAAGFTGDPSLASAAGRVAQRARIDEAVAAWTRARTSREVMAVLQAAGVPAAAMLRVKELPGFDYFRDAELFQTLPQPEVPDLTIVDNLPVRSEHMARPVLRPAPNYAEHTVEVLTTQAGLSADEVRSLEAGKVLEIGAA